MNNRPTAQEWNRHYRFGIRQATAWLGKACRTDKNLRDHYATMRGAAIAENEDGLSYAYLAGYSGRILRAMLQRGLDV